METRASDIKGGVKPPFRSVSSDPSMYGVKFTFLPSPEGSSSSSQGWPPWRSLSAQPWSSEHDGVSQWFSRWFHKRFIVCLAFVLVLADDPRLFPCVHDAQYVGNQERNLHLAPRTFLPNVHPYLSCRLVNEPWRTLSQTPRLVAPRGGIPAVLESSCELRGTLPGMGVPLCPRSRDSRLDFHNYGSLLFLHILHPSFTPSYPLPTLRKTLFVFLSWSSLSVFNIRLFVKIKYSKVNCVRH